MAFSRVVALIVAVAVVNAGVAAAAEALPARVGGKRTLVIVQDDTIEKSHSQFFDSLRARGHKLDFHGVDEQPAVQLQEYGEWNYDNAVLFAPAAEDSFGGASVDQFVDFIDGGGNVFAAASTDIGDALKDLAAECGVEFDKAGTNVIDHINYDVSDPFNDHTTVLSNNFVGASAVIGDLSSASAPVSFRGIGQAVDEDNILAVKVLSAASTAYSAFADEPISVYPESAGTDTLLVTSIQARNNARATFAGSLYMFSNEALSARVQGATEKKSQESSNTQFAERVSAWTFQERGVLRFRNIQHHRSDGTDADFQLVNRDKRNLPRSMYPEPEIAPSSLVYTIKDDLVYSVVIEQFDGENWTGYKADDVQLEFVMLDPYVRQTMKHDSNGLFKAAFKAPDVYGVYKFRVMYRRPGLSTLHTETQVSVRPFRHNEYERFIECAFPYYASAFSMMAGVFVFGIVFLYSKDD